MAHRGKRPGYLGATNVPSIPASVNVLHGKIEAWHMRSEPLTPRGQHMNTICFGPVPEIRMVLWDGPHKEVHAMIDKLNKQPRKRTANNSGAGLRAALMRNNAGQAT